MSIRKTKYYVPLYERFIFSHMNTAINKEYRKRIGKVVNFITKNLNNDLSLDELATIAGYSAFHFQKIFKKVLGESPKQYIIRLRMETAAHLVIIHKNKSIKEISFESGFSSLSTFGRAFKNYFGLSAEELRSIPIKERIQLYKAGKEKKQLIEADTIFKDIIECKQDVLNIEVKKVLTTRGIFVDSVLNSVSDIQAAFKKVNQLANNYELFSSSSAFIGIIYPHQLSYKAFVSIGAHQKVPDDLLVDEIKAGKYAAYKIKGDLECLFRTLKVFTEDWLPENGYCLGDICGFEILSENPAHKAYDMIEREIYIPIVPEA